MARTSRILRGLGAAVAVTLGLVAPAAGQEFEKNILTGGPTGTYIQFGRDIGRVAEECGMTLNVRESAGSLENFLGVRQRPFTQFGIVQSDVLEYLQDLRGRRSRPSPARSAGCGSPSRSTTRRCTSLPAETGSSRISTASGWRSGWLTAARSLPPSLVLDLTGVDRPSG